MREILFRGKRKTNGEWIYGDYFRSKIFNTELGTRVVHSITFYHNNTEHTYCVDPQTVGQYTGLTDKNGKVMEVDKDNPEHEMRLHFVAAVDERVNRDFTEPSSVWGVAFKGQGEYPAA